ncbi:hypothetical protein [Brevibacillus sp. SAFN-007a]|uniref:hypothetical protein n=1 Tax=Brevibacillus sp. SAFN-007a TaxID=3436862 RepID=UPI003F7E73AC
MGVEIQVGIVSSVNAANGSARIAFPNRGNTVSKELPVMKKAWPVKPKDLVVCLFPATGTDGFVLGSYYTVDDPPTGGA